MGAAVAPDGDPSRAFVMGQRGIAAAERISVGLGQRVADDPADVIFAQDGGVEGVVIASFETGLRYAAGAALSPSSG